MRQSNGSYPFAQSMPAGILFGSGPFPRGNGFAMPVAPGVLMTTAPLSFNCNIRLYAYFTRLKR